MKTYQHPGDVRIARNYQCRHCGCVLRTAQGLNGHLVKRHDISAEKISFRKDWRTTTKEACANKPNPVRNR